MLKDVIIRKASPAERTGVLRLLSQYFLDTEGVESREYLVAVVGGKLVGCASLGQGEFLEVWDIVVHPSYRGRGIGTALLKALLESVEGEVFLRTTSPGFFARSGFKPISEAEKRRVWKDCACCDMVCRQTGMKKP